MRILFATNLTEWGGGEFWMLTAAVGMRDRGHDVRLLVAEGAELGHRAAAVDLTVDTLQFHGDLDPVTTWRFWRHCRRHHIDVLCLNMDKVLRVGGLGARLAGTTVIPRRGSEMPVGSKLSHKFVYLNVAAGVIANSQATRNTMLESAPWLPPQKVRVIYNGINVDCPVDASARRRVREEMGASDTTPVIGMVGELTNRKNHRVVVECLVELREQWPDLQLWIAGEGPEWDALSGLAEKSGVADGLRLLGFRQDVPDLIQGMDLLCHPALREGFGYAIVEAMVAGCPVIAARTSNIPEIVAEGRTGLLVEPDDRDGWLQSILALLGDFERSRMLAEAAKTEARERFSVDRMLDETESYFRELHGGR